MNPPKQASFWVAVKEVILFSTVICLTTNLSPSDDHMTLPSLFDQADVYI